MTALLCSRWWLSSSLEGVVPLCAVAEYHLPHAGKAPVPAQCQHSIQMLAHFSNVGTQLKITENGQSISLQPGII